MSLFDRLKTSLRYIRGRLVESILIVAAIAVGVALVAAMAAFWGDYNRQTEFLLNDPAYREVVVEVVGTERDLDEAVAEYDPETAETVQLGLDELTLAMRSVSAAQYAYLADRTRLQAGVSERLQNAIAQGRFGGQGAGVPPAGTAGALAAPAAEALGGDDTNDSDSAPDAGQIVEAQPLPREDAGEEESEVERGEEDDTDERAIDAAEASRDRNQAASPAPSGGGRGQFDGAGGFNLEQLLAGSEDVITEFPVDWIATISGTEQLFAAYGLEADQGSLFTDEDVEGGNAVMVLGSDLAGRMFPDDDPIGQQGLFGIRTYTVVGVLRPSEIRDNETGLMINEMAFVPNSDAQVSFGGFTIDFTQASQTLRFAVADSRDIERAVSQIESFFEAEYGPGAVAVSARIEEAAEERDQIGRVLVVVLFLAVAALFIASINLFNLMLMRVIKRTKDVGISRAIGASKGSVFRSFLNESALLSLIGTLIGLAVSPLVYRLLASSLVVSAQALDGVGSTSGMAGNWILLVAGAAVAAGISIVFGVWPARQASRIDASLAIRTE